VTTTHWCRRLLVFALPGVSWGRVRRSSFGRVVAAMLSLRQTFSIARASAPVHFLTWVLTLCALHVCTCMGGMLGGGPLRVPRGHHGPAPSTVLADGGAVPGGLPLDGRTWMRRCAAAADEDSGAEGGAHRGCCRRGSLARRGILRPATRLVGQQTVPSGLPVAVR
jgi:hypothetical protein